MAKSLGKRLANRLSSLRHANLPMTEVREAHAISQRVVEVLKDESKPRKDALRDMTNVVRSLEHVTRELAVLSTFFAQQDELIDVAADQFREEAALLSDAQVKLELAQHEMRHLETYLLNMEYYASAIINSQEFFDVMVDMADSDYQKVVDAFERINEARNKH